MHTIEADGDFLHSNSDFSGDVIITYTDDLGARLTVKMPGRVFLGLAKRAVGRQMSSAVESAIDEWIEGSEEGGRNAPTGRKGE